MDLFDLLVSHYLLKMTFDPSIELKENHQFDKVFNTEMLG